ncbi:hypothetical protein F4677DRAFT_281541 [Hypoxylon crocopeplum]|nr:hypothetical protein F4677DRAFT_281541 [Hypoxylon crocopeplum]
MASRRAAAARKGALAKKNAPENPFLDLPRTNVIEVQPKVGRISCSNRWMAKNQDGMLHEDWRNDVNVIKAFDALNILQASRTQWLTADCLEVCTEYIYQNLPQVVSDDITLMAPGAQEIFGCSDDDFDNYMRDMRARNTWNDIPAAIRGICTKPYVIWPIDCADTGRPSWATIVIHLLQPEDLENTVEGYPYVQIESIDVLEPDYNVGRRNLICYRVFEVLRELNLYNGAGDLLSMEDLVLRNMWIPPSNTIQFRGFEPEDNFSSGLRSFHLIKQLFDRLVEIYCVRPGAHDAPMFWAPTSGWFNPDAVRGEMIGYAAMQVNHHMRYRTRIAIEPMRNLQFGNIELELTSLAPNNLHTRMYQIGRFDVSGVPVAWENGLSAGAASPPDSSVASDEVFGPSGKNGDNDNGDNDNGDDGNGGGDNRGGDNSGGDNSGGGDNGGGGGSNNAGGNQSEEESLESEISGEEAYYAGLAGRAMLSTESWGRKAEHNKTEGDDNVIERERNERKREYELREKERNRRQRERQLERERKTKEKESGKERKSKPPRKEETKGEPILDEKSSLKRQWNLIYRDADSEEEGWRYPRRRILEYVV